MSNKYPRVKAVKAAPAPKKPARSAAECERELTKSITKMGGYKYNLWDVFTDFVTTSAISLAQSVHFIQEREDEYMRIVKKYDKEHFLEFPKWFALLIEALEESPTDVLGRVFMGLELGNKYAGQFFTPSSVCEVMAQMTYNGVPEDKGYVTLHEPASGSGATVLAFAKVMRDDGKDLSRELWCSTVDVDRRAALMCYLQLSLWGIPAEVIVGNTLTLETREVWHTPMHVLKGWGRRLDTTKKK